MLRKIMFLNVVDTVYDTQIVQFTVIGHTMFLLWYKYVLFACNSQLSSICGTRFRPARRDGTPYLREYDAAQRGGLIASETERHHCARSPTLRYIRNYC